MSAKEALRILSSFASVGVNVVLHDGARRRVDLHVFEALSDGTIHYGGFENGQTFPADVLTGMGAINDVPVRCEAAEWSVRRHTGYEPRPVDHDDVRHLCRRFSIAVPASFS